MKYYKKWAFRLFMLVLTLNIVVLFLVTEFDNFSYDTVKLNILISIIGLLATVSLFAGIVMVVLIIKNKELNDSRSWIATIGLLLLFVISLIIRIAQY